MLQLAPAFWLRAISLILSSLWGAAFLAKFYGIASMQFVTLALAAPGTVLLLVMWRWMNRRGFRNVVAALGVGALGGLLGTFAYDVIRIPFALSGQRIFAPITAYGVWILDVNQSSRFTDVAGWLYHFINGITFGILYAVCLQGRHWRWAIIWGFILETIAIVSPFGTVFMMRHNAIAVIAAYLGHIAYGAPLGLLVQRWQGTERWLKTVPGFIWWSMVFIGTCAVVGPLLSRQLIERDARRTPGALRVEGARLNPEWIRTTRGHDVAILNSAADPVRVRIPRTGEILDIAGASVQRVVFSEPGIYPAFVETSRRSRSSFVIVEPVERAE